MTLTSFDTQCNTEHDCGNPAEEPGDARAKLAKIETALGSTSRSSLLVPNNPLARAKE